MRQLVRSVTVLVLGAVLGTAVLAGTSPAAAAPVSTSFRVRGKVQHATRIDLAALQALPFVDVTATFLAGSTPQTHLYRGVKLVNLLNNAQPKFKVSVKNHALSFYAVVVGTDNYQAVVAWGEIDPNFENKDVIVAYKEDGQLLTDDGFARLVVPGDKRGGRYVSNIKDIQLLQDPPRSTHQAAAGGSDPLSPFQFSGIDGGPIVEDN